MGKTFLTFWIGSFYSVESGFMNSSTEKTVRIDNIKSFIAIPQKFHIALVKYIIEMLNGDEFISVDQRLSEFRAQ